MNQVGTWWNRLSSEYWRMVALDHTPPLAAYLWRGGKPIAHLIRDASVSGMFGIARGRWFASTLETFMLQRINRAPELSIGTLSSHSKAVRSDAEGFSFSFAPSSDPGPKMNTRTASADQQTIKVLRQQLNSDLGQALIEYILVLPLILLLIVNVVNFGGFFYAWIAVSNAARAGADYAIQSGAAVGTLQTASASQLTSLVAQDLSSLPNASSLVLNICQNYNGTISTVKGTCTSVPADPEPASYVLTTVDVTYTYIPFIAAFQFPSLSVYGTLPPTIVHRRALMRVMQ